MDCPSCLTPMRKTLLVEDRIVHKCYDCGKAFIQSTSDSPINIPDGSVHCRSCPFHGLLCIGCNEVGLTATEAWTEFDTERLSIRKTTVLNRQRKTDNQDPIISQDPKEVRLCWIGFNPRKMEWYYTASNCFHRRRITLNQFVPNGIYEQPEDKWAEDSLELHIKCQCGKTFEEYGRTGSRIVCPHCGAEGTL